MIIKSIELENKLKSESLIKRSSLLDYWLELEAHHKDLFDYLRKISSLDIFNKIIIIIEFKSLQSKLSLIELIKNTFYSLSSKIMFTLYSNTQNNFRKK